MCKLEQIGEVKSSFKKPADPHEMREHESEIIIKSEFAEGLYRIKENDYLQVVFLFPSF